MLNAYQLVSIKKPQLFAGVVFNLLECRPKACLGGHFDSAKVKQIFQYLTKITGFF